MNKASRIVASRNNRFNQSRASRLSSTLSKSPQGLPAKGALDESLPLTKPAERQQETGADRFHARFPDSEIALKSVEQVQKEENERIELAGWIDN